MTDASTVAQQLREMQTSEDPLSYYKVYGERFNLAYDLVKQNQVYMIKTPRKNLEFWIVRGSKDYVILAHAAYCSCMDFYVSVVSGKAKCCKHLLAVYLAQILYKYEILHLNEKQYRELHEIWKRSIADASEVRFPFLSISNEGACEKYQKPSKYQVQPRNPEGLDIERD